MAGYKNGRPDRRKKKNKAPADYIRKRRLEVSKQILKTNLTMLQIAEHHGLSPATIYSDMEAIREEWREKYTGNIEEKKQQEVARIDAVEAEAWKAWFRSIGLHTKQTTKEATAPASGKKENDPYPSEQAPAPTIEKTTHKEKLTGDPRFLDQIQKCIEQRRKIYGLDEPARQTISDPEGGPVAFRIEGLEGAAWIPQQLVQKPTTQE